MCLAPPYGSVANRERRPYDFRMRARSARGKGSMARKRPAPESPRAAVTAERFGRLHRLVVALGQAARTRAWLLKELKLDVRGFYRDLEVLRGAGIEVALGAGVYALSLDAAEAEARLPFPDPRLTLGE